MKNQYGILTKSNRAIEAENNGLVTYSKLKPWQQRAVDKGDVLFCEWHHTGAAANRTFYYNLEDFEDLDEKNYKLEKIDKIEQPDLNRLKIKIVYDEMVGGFTTARKKYQEVEKEGLDVRKKDNVITGANGRRITSNNKEVSYFYKKPHSKKWCEISKKEAEDLGYKFL